MSDEHSKAIAVIEHAPPSAMSPVVSMGMQMLRESPNPETLRELLKVQQEWEANEARKSYAMALVGLKRDLPTVIARDMKVAFGTTKYTHASLGNVMDEITGPLTQHGFSLAWRPATNGSEVTVTCRLTHSAGHYEEATINAPADTAGSKSKPQAVASTITLLQRYTALSLLGIATADMKDPEQEAPAADAVDSRRNLRAVEWIKRQGKRRDDAEDLVGRVVAEWTSADLDKIRVWASRGPQRDPATGEPVPPVDGAP